jgi:glycosyltransferase involved in cell wall biosynthesis
MTLSLTVVICCYNSASRLSKTLHHIAEQKIQADIQWEVIIVDNASTDRTADIALEEWANLGSTTSMRIVYESKSGLAHARVAGLMAAVSTVVVFVDDDNWLANDYLDLAYRVLANDPSIGALGGQSVAVFEGGVLPNGFEAHASSFAVGSQAQSTGDITPRGYLWGAGLTVRADVLRSIFDSGVRPLLLGREGAKLTAGDDSELCKWLILSGYRLHYDETLRFSHFISLGRQSQKYLEKIHEGFASSAYILSAYQAYIDRADFLRRAFSLLPVNVFAAFRNEAKIFLFGWRVRNNLKKLQSLGGRA